MLAQNVVKLENTIVYDELIRYFERCERKSHATRVTYEEAVRYFFLKMKGKELEYLSIEDVQITLDDFEDFIKYMSNLKRKGEKVYTNATINKKVTAVKNSIKYLAAKKIVQNISYFPLIETLKVVSDHYDALTVDEVIRMSELALKEKEMSEIKRLLLLFALDTSIRKSAILKVKWSHFKEREFDYEITGVDKGNKEFTKKISKNFYNELLTIKDKSPYVFNLSVSTLTQMFDRLRNQMNFGDRRIVFHSIRKAGGSFIYNMTKDLNATRLYLGHSSPTTTTLYTNPNDYGANGAISIRDSIDKDLYKKVSLDEIIKVIDGLDSGYQMLINKKLMELKNENN